MSAVLFFHLWFFSFRHTHGLYSCLDFMLTLSVFFFNASGSLCHWNNERKPIVAWRGTRPLCFFKHVESVASIQLSYPYAPCKPVLSFDTFPWNVTVSKSLLWIRVRGTLGVLEEHCSQWFLCVCIYVHIDMPGVYLYVCNSRASNSDSWINIMGFEKENFSVSPLTLKDDGVEETQGFVLFCWSWDVLGLVCLFACLLVCLRGRFALAACMDTCNEKVCLAPTPSPHLWPYIPSSTVECHTRNYIP